MNEQIISDAVLVGVAKKGSDGGECERSLDELARLLDTAGGRTFAKMIQSKENEDPRTCIGSGKLEELKNLCSDNDIHLVVFDTELSPSQIRNIEDALDEVDVIDRSMLILDIFALHATTAEGKLQVELAQLRYTAPRLIGKGKQLSRQEGRIGTRGPGESKLETDRRHLAARAAALEAALHEMERTRSTMRAARERSGLKKVAIVGYTNAGKSTLLNRLTDAGVLAENKLFAEQLRVTDSLIAQLGAGDKPVLYAFNKADLAEDGMALISGETQNAVFISAKTGMGMDRFLDMLEALATAGTRRMTLHIPMAEQGVLNQLYRFATVEDVHYEDDRVTVTAVLDSRAQGLFKDYIV